MVPITATDARVLQTVDELVKRHGVGQVALVGEDEHTAAETVEPVQVEEDAVPVRTMPAELSC